MSLFVIVYHRQRGRQLELREFDEGAIDEATQHRLELELRWRDDPEVEVVLLGAPSLEALHRTHSRYFKPLGALLEEHLGAVGPQSSG